MFDQVIVSRKTELVGGLIELRRGENRPCGFGANIVNIRRAGFMGLRIDFENGGTRAAIFMRSDQYRLAKAREGRIRVDARNYRTPNGTPYVVLKPARQGF